MSKFSDTPKFQYIVMKRYLKVFFIMILRFICFPVAVRKYKRQPWTKEEVKIVLKAFKKDIALNQLPGKAAIVQVIDAHQCLSNRKWTNIKDFIRNYLRKGLRK